MNINTRITRRNRRRKINLSVSREMDHFSRHLTLGVARPPPRRRYLRLRDATARVPPAELAPVVRPGGAGRRRRAGTHPPPIRLLPSGCA
ncbi:hypothetical protein EVAR_61187_1 [Eumeta japonica]|uniref:Uncharacterized protein n=1 Tax=Eumeta variegata TaxID=151549 RepID=A0A4C1YTS1_EUMVA|nr:hypothetical protein EVAR_61187_1 [Eumeta japonica]